mmetsp:Transcript_2205/g.6265  ORF Transcript_2205/g.6265 Transcript_2205/m.6265 type:complete len:208 (+) Transcript_2205:2110-2733(+)
MPAVLLRTHAKEKRRLRRMIRVPQACGGAARRTTRCTLSSCRCLSCDLPTALLSWMTRTYLAVCSASCLVGPRLRTAWTDYKTLIATPNFSGCSHCIRLCPRRNSSSSSSTHHRERRKSSSAPTLPRVPSPSMMFSSSLTLASRARCRTTQFDASARWKLCGCLRVRRSNEWVVLGESAKAVASDSTVGPSWTLHPGAPRRRCSVVT